MHFPQSPPPKITTKHETKAQLTHLRSGPLAPNRQSHGMLPAAVCAHIPQSADILTQLPAQLILDRHGYELGVEIQNLLRGERADLGDWVNVEARHEALGNQGADAIEGF